MDMCVCVCMKIAGTDDQAKKSAYRRRLHKHIEEIMDDREEIARVQRLCMRNKKHSGFYIDAADTCKFQIPTTKSTAKVGTVLTNPK